MRQNTSTLPAGHHGFAEHDTLVDAIEDRDHAAAHAVMQSHLLSV
nr:FCD domain-containing protein [Pararhizobium sp. IMCC3301]